MRALSPGRPADRTELRSSTRPSCPLWPVASQAVPAVVFDFDGLVIDSETEVAGCVVEVLAAAHAAGWRVGMATGQRRPRLDEHLARLGLVGRFDAIVTRGEVAQGKPAPDIYLAA